MRILFCMACSNFHVNNFSAASLNLHSYDNKCLRYCVWRTVFARRGECMWRITEVLVMDGILVQDFKLGHVEVVLLCICNGLRAHHGLGYCCSMDSSDPLYATVTQSLAAPFGMETAISFENDWVFSCQRNVQCSQHAQRNSDESLFNPHIWWFSCVKRIGLCLPLCRQLSRKRVLVILEIFFFERTNCLWLGRFAIEATSSSKISVVEWMFGFF